MHAKENPFSSDRLHSIPFVFHDETWVSFLARLAESNYTGAIVGAHGSGKSTLLLELKNELDRIGRVAQYIQLRRQEPRSILKLLYEKSQDEVLLLDSAGCLNLLERKVLHWFCNRRGGIIFSAHRESKVPTLYKTTQSVALFSSLCEQLATDLAFSTEQLEAIYSRNEKNMRLAFFELYDQMGTSSTTSAASSMLS